LILSNSDILISWEKIVELQIELNKQVVATSKPIYSLKWYRAIWVECAELLELLDWKWWDETKYIKSKAEIELIDILHFGISSLLDIYPKQELLNTLNSSFKSLYIEFPPSLDEPDLSLVQEQVELLAATALNLKIFPIAPYVETCRLLKVSFSRIFLLYIAKNCLNKFRQKVISTSGSYSKFWNQVEDNLILIQIIDKYQIDTNNLINKINTDLQNLYDK
jgi:dUTPase